jgi:hypothetical protein
MSGYHYTDERGQTPVNLQHCSQKTWQSPKSCRNARKPVAGAPRELREKARDDDNRVPVHVMKLLRSKHDASIHQRLLHELQFLNLPCGVPEIVQSSITVTDAVLVVDQST